MPLTARWIPLAASATAVALGGGLAGAQPSGDLKAPQEAGVSRFIEGDLTGALALEDGCRSEVCRQRATAMRDFARLYERLDELDAHGLSKLLALDVEITSSRRSKLARVAGVKLGEALCKSASAAKAAGQYARAAELAQRTVQADPESRCAQPILDEMRKRAHQLLMAGYSFGRPEPDVEIEWFKQILGMAGPDSEDGKKAAWWIQELQRH